MVKLRFLICFSLFFSSICLFSQSKKKVAFTINDRPVYKAEVEKAYHKGLATALEQESVESFLPSYISYRLNLEEAHDRGIDTVQSFKKDLRSYEIQLQAKYLKDTVAENILVDSILNHFGYELEINHIYVPFDSLVLLPKDTLRVYQTVMDARQKAIDEGFQVVAEELKLYNSFGTVIDIEKETGYLGWIRPMSYSQDIEDVLFNMKHNEVSMPIRTVKGYHVFEVLNRRPAQGNPIVEQVMFGFPVIPASKHQQDSVYKVASYTYDEISLKDNFQLICDEFATAFDLDDRGCLLGELSIGSQVPLALIQAAYQLEHVGDISKPVLTDYGYHILRLKDKRPAPTQDELERFITSALQSEKVMPRLMDIQRERLKERTGIVVNQQALSKLYQLTESYSPHDSLFVKHVADPTDILVSFRNDDQVYTVQDFLGFVRLTAPMNKKQEEDPLAMLRLESMVKYTLSTDILRAAFNSFIYVIQSRYERDLLPVNNQNYANAITEISEGLLYAALLDEQIWNKSRLDQDGLAKTFEKNRKKYKLDSKMFKGLIVHSKDEDIITQIMNMPDVRSASALRSLYNADGLKIQVEEGLWKEGDNPYVDVLAFKKVGTVKGKKTFPYYTVLGNIISAPESYEDVKAQVQQDYQEELEKAWEAYLKKKYKVVINKDVIKEIQ